VWREGFLLFREVLSFGLESCPGATAGVVLYPTSRPLPLEGRLHQTSIEGQSCGTALESHLDPCGGYSKRRAHSRIASRRPVRSRSPHRAVHAGGLSKIERCYGSVPHSGRANQSGGGREALVQGSIESLPAGSSCFAAPWSCTRSHGATVRRQASRPAVRLSDLRIVWLQKVLSV